MEKEILETIVSSFISEAVNQAASLIDNISDEVKQFYNRGLRKYLEKQRDKYSYIKTLLRGNTPVYLYDIYYHLKITCNHRVYETKSVKDVFSETNYVTIIGDAGSGKSTLVKHLFLNSIYEKYAIPILIELRYLNEYSNSLEEYIFDKIFENKLSANNEILIRLLNSGKFILFLDGFDELSSETRHGVISGLSSFINKFEKNKYLLTTRPYSDIEHLPLFYNFKINGLNKENGEIEGFIHKQLQNEVELAKKIVQSIKSNQSEYIESFLRNPLLLSLYILTYQSDSSVPSKKYIFYRRVINALFSEHDSKTKLGFPREKLSGLNQEQFEEILKAFCLISFFESKYSWDSDYVTELLIRVKKKLGSIQFENNAFIKDLKLAVALWVDDNGVISFAHRSLQEYFAALYIKYLTPAENERIYSKMINRFSNIRNLNEIENFLSLCEEMDEINFKKYYVLPLLFELKLFFDTTNDITLGKSYLKFFAKAINYHNQRTITPIDINETQVYKAIYLHISYTRELYHILSNEALSQRYLDQILEGKHLSLKENEKDKLVLLHSIELSKENVPEEFWGIYGEHIIIAAKRILEYISLTIQETETYISNTENFDKEIVDLI